MSEKIILVTVSDDRFGRKGGEYEKTQAKIEHIFNRNPSFGITTFLMMRWADIEGSQFFEDNKTLLSHKDAGKNGRAYKPYAILQALNSIEMGDYAIYTDCSPEMWNMPYGFHIIKEVYDIEVLKRLCSENDNILTCFVKWKDKKLEQGELGLHKHKYFTLDRCIDKMGLRFYEDGYQHASGMMAIKKTEETVEFVEEWLKWNLVDECCALGPASDNTDSYWKEEHDFKLGHRHDQSISGLLLNKKNQKLVDIIYNTISPYNFMQYARVGQEYSFIESLPEINQGDKVMNKQGIELEVFRIDIENGKKRYIVGQLQESCYGCAREDLKLI